MDLLDDLIYNKLKLLNEAVVYRKDYPEIGMSKLPIFQQKFRKASKLSPLMLFLPFYQAATYFVL